MQLKLAAITTFALAFVMQGATLSLERQTEQCCLPEGYPCQALVVSPNLIECCLPLRCLGASPDIGKCTAIPQ
ncbi:hypothetical protein K438DRAFT_1978457 [Mycena galopus ATCC 62051]|nr:hypothetical protein K438DRAFT_1978457 [Mycena galopus ATCC 62051]